jgi:hypothetical protein
MTSQEITIGRFVYTLAPMSEGERALVLEQLLRIPGAAELAARAPAGTVSLEEMQAMLTPFVEGLMRSQEVFESLFAIFQPKATCNGKPLRGIHFLVEKIHADAQEWLFWCLRVTLGSVDQVLGEIARNATNKEA